MLGKDIDREDQEERRIDRIWRRYKKTHSSRLREELIRHYIPLLQRHARRLRARLPELIDVGDLIGSGTLGLMEAIETYDPDRPAKFETYSARRIVGSMLDELRSLDWVPRLARRESRQLLDAMDQHQLETGRLPTEDEIADRLNIPLKQIRHMLRRSMPPAMHPLKIVRDDDDGQFHDAGLIDPHSADPVRDAQRTTARDLITRGLSKAERLIVLLYYYESLSMREIGATLDLSEARVSQLHKLIMKRMRDRLSLPEARMQLVG